MWAEGVFLINNLKRTGVLLFVAMFLIGCSSSTDTEAEKKTNESEGSPEVEVETTANDYEEYPLPVLAGWAEDDTSFKQSEMVPSICGKANSRLKKISMYILNLIKKH